MIGLWLVGLAAATGVDHRCVDKVPVPYREQVQVDFLQNYIALAATFSPLHGPIPHAAGRGAVGVDLAMIPPLACKRRFALNASKTEQTNGMPVIPRPRVSFSLGLGEKWVATGGLAFVPPLPLGGQRSTLVSAEAGVGWQVTEKLQLGGRLHATAMKTLSDAATALDPEAAPADDLYLANSFGLDALVGVPLGAVTPYASVGVTDVSTLFWVGDDGVMANNLHPYFGPVASVGLDGLAGRLRWGAELYMAPGGHVRPDRSYPNEVGFGGYGRLYTARIRLGYEIGSAKRGDAS